MAAIDHLRTLYSYHFDTTLRLIASAEDLADSQILDPDRSYRRSIHDLFFHILQSDRGWRLGLETGERPEPLPSEDYGELATLKQALEQERTAWSDLLVSLKDEQVAEEVALQSRPGRTHTFGRWKIFHHILLHGMQHHAEIADALTHAGHSPGDIDFIFYSWPEK